MTTKTEQQKAGGTPAPPGAEWMRPLCTIDRGGPTDAPFVSVIDGERYLCATSGYAAICVRSDADAPTGPDVQATWAPKEWKKSDLAALREWSLADRPAVGGECGACEGAGFTEFDGIAFDRYGNGPFDDLYEKCGSCGGEGIKTRRNERARPGLLCGAPVNRNLVADYTEHVGGQSIEISTNGDTEAPCAYARGDGWLMIVMGYRGGEGPAFPPLCPTSTEAGPEKP